MGITTTTGEDFLAISLRHYAAALQRITGTAAMLLPIADTDRYVAIGTAAEIAKLLPVAAPTVQAPVQTAAEIRAQALEEVEEASEILEGFISNVSTDGPYSAEATLTFISQAKQCVDAAIRALAGQQVAQGEKGGDGHE